LNKSHSLIWKSQSLEDLDSLEDLGGPHIFTIIVILFTRNSPFTGTNNLGEQPTKAYTGVGSISSTG
jgi:hypothetical protein